MNRKNTSMTYLASVFVIAVSLLFLNTVLTSHEANAQQTPTTTGTNFTKLFSQNKEFQVCAAGSCISAVDVVYQGPVVLVLKSSYMDTIWKAVELAKKDIK